MFEYGDGSKVLLGDSVLIENGRTPATVVEIVTSREQMQQCGVEIPGVMLKSAPFGLVYLPVKFLLEDPLQFVSRS